MNKKDKEILNNFVNKKKEVIEFKEFQSIIKLQMEINDKLSPVILKQKV